MQCFPFQFPQTNLYQVKLDRCEGKVIERGSKQTKTRAHVWNINTVITEGGREGDGGEGADSSKIFCVKHPYTTPPHHVLFVLVCAAFLSVQCETYVTL